MAIRFDASTDRLLRSNPDVDGADLYSVCMWIKRVGTLDPPGGIVYSLNTNDTAGNTNIDAILVSGNQKLQSYVGDSVDSGFSAEGTTLTANQWNFVCGVRSSLGVNGYSLYLNGVLDTQNAYDCTGRTASFTREEIALLYSIDQYLFNGSVFNFMFYRWVLTPEQIRAQMRQFEPILPPPYLRLHTSMRDRGFRARHYDEVRGAYWTVGGTLTDEPNPPKAGSQFRKYFFMPLVAPVSAINVSLFGAPAQDRYGLPVQNLSHSLIGVSSDFKAGKTSEELGAALAGNAGSDQYGSVQSSVIYSPNGIVSNEEYSPISTSVNLPVKGIGSQEVEGLAVGALPVDMTGISTEERYGFISNVLTSGLIGIGPQDGYGAMGFDVSVALFGHDDPTLFGLIHTASVIDVFGVGGTPSIERYGLAISAVEFASIGIPARDFYGAVVASLSMEIAGMPAGDMMGAILSSLPVGLFGHDDFSAFGESIINVSIAGVGGLRSGELTGLLATILTGDLHGLDDVSLFGLIRTESAIDVVGVGALPSGEGYGFIVIQLVEMPGGLRIVRAERRTLANWDEPLTGLVPGRLRRKIG